MPDQENLPPIQPAVEATASPEAAAAETIDRPPPRLRLADRSLVVTCRLDDALSDDHPVRVVWAYVQGLDLSPLLDLIKAREGRPGATPADPRILLALWLYATIRGVGSARELARLCSESKPYQWICGGVSMNHKTLSEFRTAHAEFLDNLLTSSVAALMAEGLVELEQVAHDGMRVRASAGAASFRRRKTLEKCLAEAEEQVKNLRRQLEGNPDLSNRERAARQRAAQERLDRVREALKHLEQVEEQKRKRGEEEKARASTTDPEARVMKMADGGYRPAFNVQLSSDTSSQIITNVDVINTGGDQGQMAPAIEQHQQRYDTRPKEGLFDGGFAKKEDIERLSRGGVTVYAPVQKPKNSNRDPHEPCVGDSEEVAAWRRRMATAEAKQIYKQRAATIECVNALARNRGLQQFRVRGLAKAKAVVLWYALAHNLLRAAVLRAERVSRV